VRELTAPARGGIAVLSVEGPQAAERVARLVGGPPPGPGEVRLVRLRAASGELVDEALCLARGPQAFELHVHGSRPLVARLRVELGPGEGETDDGADAEGGPARGQSAAARAWALLPEAPSEAAARVLLDQHAGAWERALAALDPADADLEARLEELAARAPVARRLLAPPRVLLAGPTNAGKSTLFNAVLGRERAVVDPTPGTTRDVLEEPARLGAWAVVLVDGAGERDVTASGAGPETAAAALERAGIERVRAMWRRADVVLWLAPSADAPGPPEPAPGPARVVRVESQADRRSPAERARPNALAARDEPLAARAVVAALVREALGLPAEPWTPGAAVPFDAELEDALADARGRLAAGRPPAEALAALRHAVTGGSRGPWAGKARPVDLDSGGPEPGSARGTGPPPLPGPA